MRYGLLLLIIGILTIICLCLIVLHIFYRRQIKSVCRQLMIHRTEKSSTDYWMDVLPGAFNELQQELNLNQKNIREEEQDYRKREAEWKEFMSNVSHDIRTPITSVSGYFQLFLETDAPQKKQEYAGILKGRLEKFQEMLEDFFSYSTLISSDRKVETEYLDAVRCVSETMFLYIKEIENSFGTPEIIMPEKAICIGNKKDLSRIIQNVIKNACKYGKDHLRVQIEVSNSVVITFENTVVGGVSESDIEHVFDRSFRADYSRSTAGAGLGLCIVHELAKEMGGQATAYLKDESVFGIKIELKTSADSQQDVVCEKIVNGKI